MEPMNFGIQIHAKIWYASTNFFLIKINKFRYLNSFWIFPRNSTLFFNTVNICHPCQFWLTLFSLFRTLDNQFSWLTLSKDIVKSSFKFESFQLSILERELNKFKSSLAHNVHVHTLTSQANKLRSRAGTLYTQITRLTRNGTIWKQYKLCPNTLLCFTLLYGQISMTTLVELSFAHSTQ